MDCKRTYSKMLSILGISKDQSANTQILLLRVQRYKIVGKMNHYQTKISTTSTYDVYKYLGGKKRVYKQLRGETFCFARDGSTPYTCLKTGEISLKMFSLGCIRGFPYSFHPSRFISCENICSPTPISMLLTINFNSASQTCFSEQKSNSVVILSSFTQFLHNMIYTCHFIVTVLSALTFALTFLAPEFLVLRQKSRSNLA